MLGLIGWPSDANALNFVGGSSYTVTASNLDPLLVPSGGIVGTESCIAGGFCILVTESPIGAIAASAIYNPWINSFNAANGTTTSNVRGFNPFDPKGPTLLEAGIRTDDGSPILGFLLESATSGGGVELGTRIRIDRFQTNFPLGTVSGHGITGFLSWSADGNALDMFDAIGDPLNPVTFVPHPQIVDNTGLPDFSLVDDGTCNPTDAGCPASGLQTIGDLTGDGTIEFVREVVLTETPSRFQFGPRQNDPTLTLDVNFSNAPDGSARTYSDLLTSLGLGGQAGIIDSIAFGLVLFVPELGSVLLLGGGLAALALVRRHSWLL